MKFFYKLRLRLQRKAIQKELNTKTQNYKPIGLHQAKTIGILLNASDTEQKDKVLEFAEKLSKKGKKIRILGFFADKLEHKEVPFQYFNLKEMDRLMRPKSTIVESFMKEPFDALFAFNLNAEPVLEYISRLSNAYFKVGAKSETTPEFGYMVNVDKDRSMENFMKGINFYINHINKVSVKHEVSYQV